MGLLIGIVIGIALLGALGWAAIMLAVLRSGARYDRETMD